MGLLSVILLIPMAALVCLLLLGAGRPQLYRWIALVATVLQSAAIFGGVLPAWLAGKGTNEAGFRLVERLSWIRLDLGESGWLAADYHLGADGMSLTLILLTGIIMPIVVASSWGITKRPKGFFTLLMLLNAAITATFIAKDFFLFYIAYELMLLPMFFLIGLWGGARREYAAIKFFLYTLFGSVFMLLILVGLAFSFVDPVLTAVESGFISDAGQFNSTVAEQVSTALRSGAIRPHQLVHTFNFDHMMAAGQDGRLLYLVPSSVFDYGAVLLGANARLLAFVVLFIGFAIKVPLVPLHTWLPDAHVEAATPISVVLAGLLLKVGGYGVIRVCYGLFPEGGWQLSEWVAGAGMLSILYGALVALAQKDFKSLVAYSSISHMGFVLLGIAGMQPIGMSGATLQMFNHGIVSGALFLLVGVLYDRTHDRMIDSYSGLWNRMPRYSVMVLITFFASLGLPGLNTFVSELLVFLGSFHTEHGGTTLVPRIIPMLSVLGILLSAAFYLWTFRRMFFGSFAYKGERRSDIADQLRDLTTREFAMLVPLVILMVVLGVMPWLILNLLDADMGAMVSSLVARGRAF
jgi:NADH-quinone oxidoreductase subunit M